MKSTSRALAAVALTLALVTCRDGTGPRIRMARVAVAPVLPSDASVASYGLVIDRVRVVVVRPLADTLADTTVVLPPDSAALDLDLRVPLLAVAETLQVSIIALSGSQPLFEGTSPVEVRSGGAPATPTEIPVLTYVGPGAGVDSLVVTPGSPFIYLNDSLRFQVQAFQGGVPVPQFYVAWSTSDSAVARITGDGTLRAPNVRTSVRVIARTPGGGAADSTTVAFVPFPTQMLVISGDAQSAAVGQPLPTALEVEVRALDNLPVGGVGVRFQSLSGGAPADTIVITDAAGRARVTAVLGAISGPQSFRASVPGFASITPHTFAASAIGVISPATSVITTSAGSVASGSGVTLTLRAKDAAGNDVTTGGATVVFSASGGTSTGTIAPAPATDNGDGTYSAMFTGVVAGTATTIGAAINGAPVTTARPALVVNAGPLAAVVASPAATALTALGQTQQYSAAGRDANGNPVATTVTWSSTIPAVAGISGGGLATAVGNGTTAIIATAPAGPADTVTLSVQQVVTSVLVSPSADTLYALSDTAAFTAVARDANDSVVAGESFTWTSSDTAIASVDAAGLATAAGNGSATITAQAASSGTSGSGTVVVSQVIASVTASPLLTTLTSLGATQSFTAVARDSNAFLVAGAAFAWSSSDTTIATVDGSGNATAVRNGATRITASASGLADSVDLFVSQIAQRLAFTVEPATAAAGTAISPAVEVTAQDSLGSAVATYADSITIAIGTNPPGGLLSGTVRAVAAAGRAIFANLSIDQPGSGYTLTAGAPGLAGATSAPFTIASPASVVFWTNAAGGSWSTASNWSSGSVPSLGDTAVITLDGSYTVTVDVSDTVGGLRIGGPTGSQRLAISSPRTLGVGGALQVNANGILDVAGSTLSGAGTLTNDGVVKLRSGTINKPVVNRAAVWSDGTSALTGALTTSSGSVIRVQGNNVTGFSRLTVAAGFINNGQILLTDSASASGSALDVTTGTLTNSGSAAILADLGAGGQRQLNTAIDNQGALTVSVAGGQSVTVNRAGAVHANTGTIRVTSGTLSFTQSGTGHGWANNGTITLGGGNLSLTQSGSGTSFSNGAIEIGPGDSLKLSGGTFDYTAGAIHASPGPGGAIVLQGGVVATFTPSFTNDSLDLSLTNASLEGTGTITNAAGRTIKLRSSAIVAPFINDGALLVDGTTSIDGPFSTGTGSLVRVQGNNVTGFSRLTLLGGSFTNNGQIVLTDSASASGAGLDLTTGILTNASGASILAEAGAGGGRQLNAAFDNQGTFTVNAAQPVTVNKSAAQHVNSGSIVVSAGQLSISQTGAATLAHSGTINLSGGNLTVSQATTDTFIVTGSILIGAGRTFTVGGGRLKYESSARVEGLGEVVLQSAVTLDNMVAISNDTLGLRLANATIQGPGTLTNAAGRTIAMRSSTVNAPLITNGTFLIDGTNTFGGPVSTGAGSLIRVQGNNVTGFSRLTVANGFINNGQIRLTDSASASGAGLDVTNGTLTNSGGAAILAELGGGGSRQLNAALDNQGALTVSVDSTRSLSVTKANAAHLNTGTITIASGALTITQSGTSSFAQNGALDAAGGDFALTQAATGSVTLTGTTLVGANRVFSVGGGTFAYNAAASLAGTGTVVLQGGVVATLGASFSNDTLALRLNNATVNGTGTLTNVAGRTLAVRTAAIGAPFVNNGALLADGTNAVTGSLATAGTSVIRVQGNNVTGFSRLTVASGFTNNGQILITDSASGAGAGFDVTAGALVNAPGASIQADSGAGGPRQLNVLLDNRGLLVLTPAPGQNVTVNKPAAAHQNSGTVTIARGTLSISGAGTSFTNTSGGLIQGAGVLSMPSATFTNGGTVKPGVGGTGILTIVGNYVQSAGGTLSIELGGLTAGTQYDRLVDSAGTATLDGVLDVSLVNGFAPALGDTFTVLTFPARTGSIPMLNGLVVGGGVRLDTVYTATGLRLVAVVLQTTHTGDITTDETWSAANNPHVVSGNVKILNGATLTIEDGATVKFDAGAGLQVGDTALGQAGGLAMLGTPGSIRLTANTATPVPGSWTGIEVQRAIAPILWRNVDIEYAGGPRANPFNEACILLVDPAAAVELDSLHIRQCVHAGVHHFAGNLRMHRSQIDSVTGSGIHSDFTGVLRLDSTTIRGSGEEGLFVGTSAVDLAGAMGNRFVGNAVAGVHMFAHQLAGFGRQDSIVGNGFAPGGVGDSIVVDSGTVATNVAAFTIFRQPAPYLVTGFVTVASPGGQEVTLDSGLVMAFDTLGALSIGDFADAAGNTSGVSARLVSMGTAASPVVLRNRLGRPGWTGLYLGAQTGTPVVRHLRLVNGGYQAGSACGNCEVLVQGGFEPFTANLYVDAPIGSAPFVVDSVESDSSRFRGIVIKRSPPAGLQLRNSRVTNSAATGLVVLTAYNPNDTIAANVLSGNYNPLDIDPAALPALGINSVIGNARDTLWLRAGTLIASDTLPDFAGAPWWVTGALVVDSGATLTILPGDTVFFKDSVSLTIGGGTPSGLDAHGSAGAPIVLTSKPGQGPWLGIVFANMSSSVVNNVVIEGAGRSLPCFGDCSPTPVAAVRYVNASPTALTLDSVTIRQSVTMALFVDSAAASPLAIVNSQFYANPYSPMIKSRNPTLLSIHGSDLYHYNAQIIQTLNANTDSIDATDNWWGDVDGLARGFEFSDSLGRASLWFNAVRFAPMSVAPHFAVGPAAQIVAARDTILNSGYGVNSVIGDPDSIRARVLDAQGRGVFGYDVQWGTSTGFVSFLSSLTDAGGRVGSVWTTSTVAGDQLVQAVGPGLGGSPVNWRTTLQPGPTVSTNWQLVAPLTQGSVSAGLDTAYFTSANRASALVSNAVDAFGNRTTPTSGFFFSTVPNTGFQFPPFGQVDSIHGDTVFFRVLVSNPTLYQVHGLYDGGLIQDSLFLSVTAAPAGIRIAQDSAVFTSICPTDPANAFCEQRFWAEVVDSSGAPLPPSGSYTFTWSRDPGALITIARTTGLAQDTVFVTARGNGTTWVTVDETQQGTLVPTHDSLPIRIQQVTASVTVVPDTISARIGDNLIFDGTPRDQGGTPTADTIHWAEDFAGTLAFLDTTSVFNQATVRLIGTSFGTTNVLAIVNGVNLGFAQVYNPVQGLIPGVGNETNGVVVNAGLVYVATDTGVAMIDQSDRVSTFIPIPEPTYYLAHDRANNRIYAGARFSSTIYVIDGFTNTLQRNFQVNGFFVPQFAVDESTGNLLVPTVVCVGTPACVNVDFLAVFNSDGGLVDTIPIGDQGIALAFDQAARKVFVGVFAGPLDSIKVIDLAQRKAVDSIEVGSSLANLAYNPVTRLLYASDYNDNTVHVIDGTTHQLRNRVFVGAAPEGIAIDTVRNRIYVANTGDPTIYVIDGETDAVVQFISVAVPTSQAAVWQGGNQLYVNSFGRGDVRVLKF